MWARKDSNLRSCKTGDLQSPGIAATQLTPVLFELDSNQRTPSTGRCSPTELSNNAVPTGLEPISSAFRARRVCQFLYGTMCCGSRTRTYTGISPPHSKWGGLPISLFHNVKNQIGGSSRNRTNYLTDYTGTDCCYSQFTSAPRTGFEPVWTDRPSC